MVTSYLLMSWCTTPLEKQTVTQSVMNFLAFHGTKRFSSVHKGLSRPHITSHMMSVLLQWDFGTIPSCHARRTHLVSALWRHIQYVLKYPPYLEAVSSTYSLNSNHATLWWQGAHFNLIHIVIIGNYQLVNSTVPQKSYSNFWTEEPIFTKKKLLCYTFIVILKKYLKKLMLLLITSNIVWCDNVNMLVHCTDNKLYH